MPETGTHPVRDCRAQGKRSWLGGQTRSLPVASPGLCQMRELLAQDPGVQGLLSPYAQSFLDILRIAHFFYMDVEWKRPLLMAVLSCPISVIYVSSSRYLQFGGFLPSSHLQPGHGALSLEGHYKPVLPTTCQ
jgi:hypothetical protein